MPRGSRNTPEHLRLRERDGLKFADLEDMYMSGEAVVPLQIAEWQEETEHGPRLRIVRGEKAIHQVPGHASRYWEKTFSFPTGTVRELKFDKAHGGMFRNLNPDNYLYMLEGEGAVICDDQTIQLEEGDAVRCCHGAILRGAESAKVIVWDVSDPGSPSTDYPDGRLSMLQRSESKVTESAQWDVNGERYVATDPEDRNRAPEDAIRLKIELRDFGCNVTGLVTSYKGGPTYEAASRYDNYLYIVSGSYRYFQDDIEFEARAGDVIREIGGHYHHWIRHEDSSFLVVTSVPVVASPSH